MKILILLSVIQCSSTFAVTKYTGATKDHAGYKAMENARLNSQAKWKELQNKAANTVGWEAYINDDGSLGKYRPHQTIEITDKEEKKGFKHLSKRSFNRILREFNGKTENIPFLKTSNLKKVCSLLNKSIFGTTPSSDENLDFYNHLMRSSGLSSIKWEFSPTSLDFSIAQQEDDYSIYRYSKTDVIKWMSCPIDSTKTPPIASRKQANFVYLEQDQVEIKKPQFRFHNSNHRISSASDATPEQICQHFGLNNYIKDSAIIKNSKLLGSKQVVLNASLKVKGITSDSSGSGSYRSITCSP